jgi:hypothetical protein
MSEIPIGDIDPESLLAKALRAAGADSAMVVPTIGVEFTEPWPVKLREADE